VEALAVPDFFVSLCDPKKYKSKDAKSKIRWTPKPLVDMIKAMLSAASGCRLKRSENGGLVKVPMTQSLSLKPVVGFQPSFGL
jgi:hypothetical protein